MPVSTEPNVVFEGFNHRVRIVDGLPQLFREISPNYWAQVLIGVDGGGGASSGATEAQADTLILQTDQIEALLGVLRDSLATQATQLEIRDELAREGGAWSYMAGMSGTVVVPGGARVLGIATITTDGAASVTINGGPSIGIPANASWELAPRGNLVAPTIVFTGTYSYMVEHVS
jgi:hypothetical protein